MFLWNDILAEIELRTKGSEKILQELILWGRKMEDTKNNEMLQWLVGKKIEAALGAGLKVILCVDRVSQIKNALKEIGNWKLKIENLAVAYEPLFAIGTGKACPPEKAEKMRVAIKKVLGESALVLYGGSVNSQNTEDYIKKAHFDGLLVGGASLKPQEFIDIVKIAC